MARRIAGIAEHVVDAVEERYPLKGAAVVDLAWDDGLDVAWAVADATETGLESGSIDAVVSSMGIIFVEPAAQVAELARVLKPRGLLGFSAWVRVRAQPVDRSDGDGSGTTGRRLLTR
ncbi:class I SAM-dependent methyltransferase [Mycolicibacterium baixiangningiae]|uniref:class I SAM-dependent methyltransferase n=1 Tax=Mycolicibacterium baixiangningiae TaxID=2761578 RepID=UPI0027DA4930|nr:methyltransferase domain-containing protein [Mycolicibacterium baixiangningiae]